MQRLTRAVFALVLLLTVITGLAGPLWYWDGGLIEIESTQFVRQYLDDRSALQKVFDPHGNDLDTYQARELSYLVDYVDARVFEAFMVADRPVFVPASAAVATVVTLLLCILAMRRFPAAAQLPAALLLLAYVTNYVHVVTTGMLYRSAKPLLAPVLVGAAFYIVAILRENATSRRRAAPLVVFLLFSVMSLLDRQGFFYAVAGTVVLAIHAVRGGRRDVLAAGAAAVILMVVYNLSVAPMLVERINGYTPSFVYQQIPWQNLLTEPRIVGRAFVLVLQSLASLMGGGPPWLFGLALLVGAAAVLFRGRLPAELALAGVFVIVMQIALVALMIARHPPIYEYYDHRVWYYPLPFQALLTALLIMSAGHAVPSWRAPRVTMLNVVLAAIVVGNVWHWNDYRRAQLRSRWFPEVYMQNLALKASLSDGRARPSLSPEFFAFFEFWRMRAPALRERAQGVQEGRD